MPLLLAGRREPSSRGCPTDVGIGPVTGLSQAPARRSRRRARRATSSRRPRRRAAARPSPRASRGRPRRRRTGSSASSASRIRLPSVSSRSSASARTPASRSAPSELVDRLAMRLRDRQHAHLDRREPDRERAGVVLDQDPHESLQRAEQRAVDDVGRVLDVVRAHVREPELLRHLRVELDRPHLPRAGRGRRACGGRSSARRTRPLPRRRSTRCSRRSSADAERALREVPFLVGAELVVRAASRARSAPPSRRGRRGRRRSRGSRRSPSSICSRVQKMCASSCVTWRTRSSPCSVPVGSLRCSVDASA